MNNAYFVSKTDNGLLQTFIRKIKVFSPKEDQVLVKNVAIGLNYIDTEYANGIKKCKSYPFVSGYEASGVVVSVGENVRNFIPGDRVAYCIAPLGACCMERIINEKYLVKVPQDITHEIAAGFLFKGIISYYLSAISMVANPDSVILITSAAGGIGYILAQLLRCVCKFKSVIGLVGTQDKYDFAKKHGYDRVFLRSDSDLQSKIGNIDVIYDCIGGDFLTRISNSLSEKGIVVSYGGVSGDTNINAEWVRLKSARFSAPNIFNCIDSSNDMRLITDILFGFVNDGRIFVKLNRMYDFKDIALAYSDMSQGNLYGSNIILVP